MSVLRFGRRRERKQWSRRNVAAALVILVAAILTLLGLTRVQLDTGAQSLIPDGRAALRTLEVHARRFGDQPVVVLLESREGTGLLEDQASLPRVLQLEGELAHLPHVASVYGPATVLNQIAGAAQNLMARISGSRDALGHQAEQRVLRDGGTRAEARRAAFRATRAFDRRYSELLVRGLPAGLPTLRNPRFVRSVLLDRSGRTKRQWRLLHPDEHTVAILVRPRAGLDQGQNARLVASVRTAVHAADLGDPRVTVTGLPAVTAGVAHRASDELPILGAAAVIAVGLVYLLAPWSRRRRSRLRPPIAALTGTAVTLASLGWLGLPISLGVVAFLPILVGIGSDFPLYLSQVGPVRRPVVAGVAAASGFASLGLSPLPFVRELGLAVAAGLLVTLAVGLAMRRLLGPVEPPASPARPRTTAKLRVIGLRKRALVLAVGAAVAGSGLVAGTKLDVETRPDALAHDLPELASARHAQAVLGYAGEVSLVLKGPDVTRPGALVWLRSAERAIESIHDDNLRPLVGLSGLLAFLGDDPTAEQVRAGLDMLPPYLQATVLSSDRSEALVRFGVAVDNPERQRATFRAVRQALPAPPAGYQPTLVGLPVAAVSGLDLISTRSILMNLVGLAAAGLVLLMGLRHRRDAGRAMLTVVLAFGWALAAAWLLGGALNPLTVAIGSLTVATGCEFAVMLQRIHGPHRRRAVRGVELAGLAGGAGYLVLCLSDLALLRGFGTMLAASVVLSYAAARLVTWALPEADLAHATDAVERDAYPSTSRGRPDIAARSASLEEMSSLR